MEQVVTVRKLSRLTRLPMTWLREEADAGRLPCLRVGRRLLFNPAAVEAALAERAASTEQRQAARP